MDVDSLFMVNKLLEAKHEACCYTKPPDGAI